MLALPLRAQSVDNPQVEFRFEIPDGTEVTEQQLRRFAGSGLRPIENGEGSAAALADVVYRMRQNVITEGYPKAGIVLHMYNMTPAGEVEIDRSADWGKVDLVRLEVRPGRRVRMGSISFEGNSAYGDQRLRSFFSGGDGAYFVRAEIDAGVARIRRFYALDGYVNFTIEEVRTDSRESPEGLFFDVTVRMREGARYLIDRVGIEGAELTESERTELYRELDLIGRAYFPRRISEGALRLERVLGERGYRPEIENSVDLRQEGRALVTYRIQKGPRQVFDSVRIDNSGSTPLRTSRAFLRSFITLSPGETVDFSELDRIESRLYGLGIFAYVDLHTVPVADTGDPRRVTLVAEVEELSSQYLELEAGWNSYELVRGDVTFIDRNLFGLGRQISLRLHGSFKAWGTEASLSDRLLLGQGSTVALTGRYSYRESPSFTQSTAGGDLSLSYQFTPAVGAGGSYEYTRSVTSNVEGDIVGSEREVLSTGRVRVFGEYDTRNSVVFPVRGTYLQGGLFTAPRLLGSDIGFYGGNGEVRFHIPLFDRLTVTAAADYRFRARYGSLESLPIQERLFLGGSNSVRAFGQDELGLVSEEGSARGGMSAIKLTAETRIRVVGSLYGALFWDGGLLAPDPFDLNGEFGHGPGIGVQYNLPIGPIRLDWAWNPGKLYASDSRSHIHLAVGLSY